MSPTVFVTGATGYQGGAVARELLKANVKVHALARDVNSPAALALERLGAQIFQGSFEDYNSLVAAATGTTGAFLNLFATPDEVPLAENVIKALKEVGTVTSVIYSSVSMTGKHEQFPGWGPDYQMYWYWKNKHAIETLVRESGFEFWTILRPAALMKIFEMPMIAVMFPELSKDHVFRSPIELTTKVMLLDEGDVGKFATAAILDPHSYNHHEIELGVEALTPIQIAEHLKKAIGKDIKVETIPRKEAEALMKQNPVILSQLWLNEVGYQVDLAALDKYPIKRTSFAEYLENHQDEVQKTFS